jgi:hypothetical protein
MKSPLLVIFICVAFSTWAQKDSVYTYRYIDRSTRFGWTTLGGDVLTLQGGKAQFQRGAELGSARITPTFIPRLTIGGVHFWGHADFYVTFPLSFLAQQEVPTSFSSMQHLEGIETGARVYPFALKPASIRPFVGVSMRLKTYSHETSDDNNRFGGADFQRMVSPLQVGASYATDKYIISLAAHHVFMQKARYYDAPGTPVDITFEPWSFNISYLRYWDTDKGMRGRKSVAVLNRMHEILEKENRLSAWYWGVGPSAGLQTSRSPFLRSNFAYLYNDYFGGFMPDITFGRFFSKANANVGVSYRTIGDRVEAFDTRIRLRRHSYMLETYKFLFNWLGFAPYAGVTTSIEQLSVNVNGVRYSDTKPALGLIFGWDIRVTETGTNTLRTNLRYIPNLHLDVNGEAMMFDHLEFNFIQWVQFIGRKKAYKKYAG